MNNGNIWIAAAAMVILFLLIALGPSIVWLVIGNNNLKDECNQELSSPSLATWLVVEGSVGILSFVLALFGLFFISCLKYDACFWGLGIDAILLVLIAWFQIAWLIVGSIQLAQDTECREKNPVLWNTTLAAVIIGFVGVLLNFFSTTYRR
jgi:hypothetical protein